ncbi:MAG: hypothetical protein AAF706_01705, partial [Bacteroidota bacterium]
LSGGVYLPKGLARRVRISSVRAPLADIPRPIAHKIDLLADSYLRTHRPIPLPDSGHTQA